MLQVGDYVRSNRSGEFYNIVAVRNNGSSVQIAPWYYSEYWYPSSWFTLVNRPSKEKELSGFQKFIKRVAPLGL